MSFAAASASKEADTTVPQQCIKISKDLMDKLLKNLLKSASPGTNAAYLQSRVEQRLAKILPSIKTPDHPPYALMIRQAITELDEEGGSNEEAISELIKHKYKDLPWGHVNFLRHHLKKLKDEKEIFQVSGNRYKLLPEDDDSIGKVKKSKKRKRRSGKEKNYVDEEDQEKSGDAAALHFKEFEVQKNQNEEQQKQEVTCGSRKESQLGLEVNDQVHLDSEECEGTMDATREEALHHMEDADGLEQQKEEVTCPPRQETFSVNEEVSQVHILEDATREPNSAEEPCVPSQLVSETGEEADVTPQKECQGMEDVNPTVEAATHFIATKGQALLQGQEKEFSKNQSREVSCTASKQKILGFEVNGEANQLEKSVAIEEENSAKELSTTVVEDLQQKERIEEEPSEMEEENGLSIEGEKEEREQTESIEKQKEDLDQMKEENSLAIEGEKEEITRNSETEDQQEVICEKQDAPGQNVSKGAENLTEEQCDGLLQVAVIEKGQVKAVGLQMQQQQWEPEVNEQNLQLKEIGAAIVECIENIITPQIPPKLVVGNKSCTREGEACGIAANLISSPALSNLRQREQCHELLSRTARMQLMVVELLKSIGKAESSRRPSDLAMLESNESELSDEQLPNATAETALPSCRDVVLVEPPPQENVDISCSTRLEEGKEAEVSETELPLELDLPVVEPPPQEAVLKDSEEHQEVAVVVEPKEQVEQLCNSSTNTLLQSEVPEVGSALVGEEATKTSLLLNLNSTLDVSGFLPEQEALKNKEPSAESYIENSLKLKLPDLQPETVSSSYLKGKEIPGHSVSANPTLLSLSLASQEQQQKPTDFVDGNQQLYQQKEELPTPLPKKNAEPSFWQQHVQSETQSVNMQKEELPTPVLLQQNAEPSVWQKHVQSESQSVISVKIAVNNEMLQPNLLQGGPKAQPPFGGDANTGLFSTPQKQQHEKMLSPQLPSSFDAGSLFGNSLFQQPFTISPMKPSSLSGGKLQPLKPIELKNLMEESLKPTPPKPKPMGTLQQQVVDVDEIEQLREVASSSVGGFKRKLQFQASPVKSPSLMGSDMKVGEVVGESEQVTPKKRRGRPPKQQTPGQTPSPQSGRPKIRQTVPKKKPSQSPSKRVKVAPIVEEPVIIPRNPF